MGVALVTGTSSGIGLSTAVLLASAGHRVVATLRELGTRAALGARAKREGVSLEVRALDVADPMSIERCVRGVLADHGAIDVLVNNAGFGMLGSVEHARGVARHARTRRGPDRHGDECRRPIREKFVDPSGDSVVDLFGARLEPPR